MNKLSILLALLVLTASGITVNAQRRVLSPDRGRKPVRDSLVLGCILDHPIVAPDDEELNVLGEKELKIVVSSNSDTTVKAPWDLVVSSVKRLEDGNFEVVASHQDYWFWFSGIEKAKTYKGQTLKKGDAIGFLETGKKVELLVFDFETPLDPKKYFHCR